MFLLMRFKWEQLDSETILVFRRFQRTRRRLGLTLQSTQLGCWREALPAQLYKSFFDRRRGQTPYSQERLLVRQEGCRRYEAFRNSSLRTMSI
jgi:hypothetical protein